MSLLINLVEALRSAPPAICSQRFAISRASPHPAAISQFELPSARPFHQCLFIAGGPRIAKNEAMAWARMQGGQGNKDSPEVPVQVPNQPQQENQVIPKFAIASHSNASDTAGLA